MTWIGGVTLGIAILGAALGVINTWHSLDSSRVKLRVVPGHAIPVGIAPRGVNVYVAVTNMSTFPVTVNEVGFFLHGTDKRAVFMQPIVKDGGPWLRRLESRSSVSVYGAAPDPLPRHAIRCAYAMTDCGVTKEGKSPALRQVAREGGR